MNLTKSKTWRMGRKTVRVKEQGREETYMVPAGVLCSQATVAYHKQDISSMYDTVYSVYYTLYLVKFLHIQPLHE